MIYWHEMNLLLRRPLFAYAVLFSLLCFCVVALLLFFADRSRANTTSFYPATCLGGWKDVDRAAGKPEAFFDAPQNIHADNSAVVGDQVAELYCGDWKGDMPPDGLLKSAILKLSWRFIDDDIPLSVSMDTLTDVATTTESFTETASVIETISELFGDASSTEPVVPILDESSAPAFVEPIENVDASTPPSVSTGSLPDSPLPTDADVSVPPSVDPVESVDAPAQGAFLWGLVGLSAHAEEEPIAYIEYTLDGAVWKSLAIASRTNLPREIVLPHSDFGSWENLSGLQVKIRRVATISSYPDIVLDGMAIEIDYSEDQMPVVIANPSDTKYLRITDVVSNGHMYAAVISDDDQGESIAIRSDFAGSIRFYNDADYSFVMASGIGDDELVIPAYTFSPGLITAVLTRDPDACMGITVEDCEASDDFLGAFNFRINATALTPVPSNDILEEE